MLWRLWRLDCQSIVRACIPFPYTAFYQSFFIFSDSLGGAASHYIDEKTSRKPRCHSHSLHIFGRNQVRIVTIQAIINAGHQRTSGKVVGPIFWGRECEVYLWEMCQKPGNNRFFKKWCVLRRKLEMRVGENWRWEFKVEAVLSIFSHPITSLNFMTPLPARHLIGSGRSQVGPSWFKTVYKYSTPKQEGKSLPSFERFRVFVFFLAILARSSLKTSNVFFQLWKLTLCLLLFSASTLLQPVASMLVEPCEGATAVLSNRLIALRLLRVLPSRISSEVWWGQRSTSVCGIGNDSKRWNWGDQAVEQISTSWPDFSPNINSGGSKTNKMDVNNIGKSTWLQLPPLLPTARWSILRFRIYTCSNTRGGVCGCPEIFTDLFSKHVWWKAPWSCDNACTKLQNNLHRRWRSTRGNSTDSGACKENYKGRRTRRMDRGKPAGKKLVGNCKSWIWFLILECVVWMLIHLLRPFSHNPSLKVPSILPSHH